MYKFSPPYQVTIYPDPCPLQLHLVDKIKSNTNITLINRTEIGDIQIFPNPANDLITIASKKDRTIQSLEIIDFFGPTVKKVIVNNQIRFTEIVAALKPGV